METEYRYENLYPDDIYRIKSQTPIIYLPLGSLVWHDMHAPLGTDSFIAQGISLRMAQRTGGVVLPPHYWSVHGAGARRLRPWTAAEGSIYFSRPEIWAGEMRAWVDAVFREGWRVAVFVSGHLGQPERHILRKIAMENQLTREPQVVSLFPYLYTQGDHAGRYETSLLMALEPLLVRTVPSAGNPFARESKTLASCEEGERQLEQIMNAALPMVEDALAQSQGRILGVEEYAKKISRKYS